MNRLRWLWWEWGMPVVVGLPLAGVVIWISENPPFGQPALVAPLLGAILLGGMIAGVRVLGVMDDDYEDGEDPFRWWWVLAGAAFGAWLFGSMPLVFQPPSFTPVDVMLRASWTLGGLWVVGLAAVRGRKGALPWFGALFGVENLLLWGVGPYRTLGIATGVLWCIGLWLYMRDLAHDGDA